MSDTILGRKTTLTKEGSFKFGGKIEGHGDILKIDEYQSSLKSFDFTPRPGDSTQKVNLEEEDGKKFIGMEVIRYTEHQKEGVPNPIRLLIVGTEAIKNIKSFNYIYKDVNENIYKGSSSSHYLFEDFMKYYNLKLLDKLQEREAVIRIMSIENRLMKNLLKCSDSSLKYLADILKERGE